MDLSFLTGQQKPNAFTWGNPQGNNDLNFMGTGTPNLNYANQVNPLSFGSNPIMPTGEIGGLTNKLGFNVPTFQLGLGTLGTLGNLYGAFQANRLAKDQLNFTKDVTNTNLNNQVKSYNTALEDRARSRAVAENRSQASADKYIEENRLTR